MSKYIFTIVGDGRYEVIVIPEKKYKVVVNEDVKNYFSGNCECVIIPIYDEIILSGVDDCPKHGFQNYDL